MALEKIVGKGENAGNQHFLLLIFSVFHNYFFFFILYVKDVNLEEYFIKFNCAVKANYLKNLFQHFFYGFYLKTNTVSNLFSAENLCIGLIELDLKPLDKKK